MLIGRDHERAKLSEAISERRSLLISGPPDSGKSALLHDVLAGVDETIRRRCIVSAAESTPHAIWLRLVQAFGEADDPEVLTRVENEEGSRQHFDRWTKAQTSLRLRGILRRAARAREYWIFLDTAGPLPDGVYRLLQEWVWSRRTPVVLLARDSTQTELGKAAKLYWHSGLRLALGPLDLRSAEALLEHSMTRLHLANLADAAFRSFVLAQSARFPGAIVRLCELASDVAYHYEGHVKLHTLAVDFALQQRRPAERAARHA
jgi:hypothetical protein